MKAFEVMATVKTPNELKLDHTIEIETSSRVKVIVLVEDDNDLDDTPDEEIEDSLRRSLQEAKEEKRLPLEGTVYYYDDPCKPVAEDEWEVLQ